MAAIVLVPALICGLVLALGSARRALLDVYLPALLLLPQYYVLRLPHLPPLGFADAAILPLGTVLIATQMRRWRWAWMDLWVLLLAASQGLSEAMSTELANGDWLRIFSADFIASPRFNTNLADGALMFVDGVLTMVLPYMAGRLLIEQDGERQAMREKLVARIAVLLAVVALVSVRDFLTGTNGWQRMMGRIFPNAYESWPEQVRWGFGRIAGPYGHAILAGMVFLMGLIYCLWLCSANHEWGARRLMSGLPVTGRGLALAAIVAGLLMTQSRGPWIGVALALVFALLTRYLPVAKAAAAFLVFIACFATLAIFAANRYTARQMRQASSEEQRNAIYRRELLANYAPVVRQRMLFGWGVTTYPAVNGQQSIDNQYLMLAVKEGFAGLGIFLTIVAGTAAKLLRLIAQPMEPRDRMLAFAHMSVLIGLVATLATVYLGEQVVMLFFLLTGWVQAMRAAPALAPVAGPLDSRAGFRRVLV
jgi:hypothetical protein